MGFIFSEKGLDIMFKIIEELKEKNKHLLNTTTDRGFYITEILILPSDAQKRKNFFLQYLSSNADVALVQYLNEDLVVWAIDVEHLKKANVLFYKELTK